MFSTKYLLFVASLFVFTLGGCAERDDPLMAYANYFLTPEMGAEMVLGDVITDSMQAFAGEIPADLAACRARTALGGKAGTLLATYAPTGDLSAFRAKEEKIARNGARIVAGQIDPDAVMVSEGSVFGAAVVGKALNWKWDSATGKYTFMMPRGDETLWYCYFSQTSPFFTKVFSEVSWSVSAAREQGDGTYVPGEIVVVLEEDVVTSAFAESKDPMVALFGNDRKGEVSVAAAADPLFSLFVSDGVGNGYGVQSAEGVSLLDRVDNGDASRVMLRVRAPSNEVSTAELLARARKSALVASAQYNVRYAIAVAPQNAEQVSASSFYPYDWNRASSTRGVDADVVWRAGVRGKGVLVAVLDTGVATHPLLQNVLWRNADEVCGNALDDDKNGYVDDCAGWNFAQMSTENADVLEESSDVTDGNGHGTHVSGIVAGGAEARPGEEGVTPLGVAPDATVMPVKVMTNKGEGTTVSVSQGVRYAVDNGARIINVSLVAQQDDPVVRDAIAYAQHHGVLVVAAMGNDGVRANVSYPAAYPGVIAVGAMQPDRRVATYSSTGAHVTMIAPGSAIRSTYLGNSVIEMQGSSMAAPHVAGVAALFLEKFPNSSLAQLREYIAAGTVQMPLEPRNRAGAGMAYAPLSVLRDDMYNRYCKGASYGNVSKDMAACMQWLGSLPDAGRWYTVLDTLTCGYYGFEYRGPYGSGEMGAFMDADTTGKRQAIMDSCLSQVMAGDDAELAARRAAAGVLSGMSYTQNGRAFDISIPTNVSVSIAHAWDVGTGTAVLEYRKRYGVCDGDAVSNVVSPSGWKRIEGVSGARGSMTVEIPESSVYAGCVYAFRLYREGEVASAIYFNQRWSKVRYTQNGAVGSVRLPGNGAQTIRHEYSVYSLSSAPVELWYRKKYGTCKGLAALGESSVFRPGWYNAGDGIVSSTGELVYAMNADEWAGCTFEFEFASAWDASDAVLFDQVWGADAVDVLYRQESPQMMGYNEERNAITLRSGQNMSVTHVWESSLGAVPSLYYRFSSGACSGVANDDVGWHRVDIVNASSGRYTIRIEDGKVWDGCTFEFKLTNGDSPESPGVTLLQTWI